MQAIEHPDKDAVEMLRVGAPMVGILPKTCTGLPKHYEQRLSIEELRKSIKSRNRMLLSSLKVDKHQKFINNIIKYIKQVDRDLDKYYI